MHLAASWQVPESGLQPAARILTLRESAEPAWGDSAADVLLAGQAVRVRGLTDKQVSAIATHFGHDLVVPVPANNFDFESEVSWRCKPGLRTLELSAFDVGGVYTPALTHDAAAARIRGYGFEGWAIIDGHCRGQMFASDEPTAAKPDVFENYLRFFCAYLAVSRGGLLLHSAVIETEGEAILFLGHSGAGKTTISRTALAQTAGCVLSDDMAFIVPEASESGRLAAWPVPFSGEIRDSTRRKGVLPVGRVAWLKKGPKLAINQLAPAKEAARLVASSPYINTDPFRLDRVLAIASRFSQIAPMVELTVPLTANFAEIVALLNRERANAAA